MKTLSCTHLSPSCSYPMGNEVLGTGRFLRLLRLCVFLARLVHWNKNRVDCTFYSVCSFRALKMFEA